MPSAVIRDPLISGSSEWRTALAPAARCESDGAARLWLSDEGAAVALGAGLGRRTGRLRIGLVVSPGRRPLTVLAKELSSLDVLLEGRLDVALVPGADQDELAEDAAVLRRLASGAALVHASPRIQAQGARCLPPARQRPAFPVYAVHDRGPDWLEAEEVR